MRKILLNLLMYFVCTVGALNAQNCATITANGPTTFCQGGSVTLTASVAVSYLWSTGATTRAITATVSGSYTVHVTSPNCTSTSAATIVTVNPLPNAILTVSGPTTFCQGGSVTLTASANDSLYHWSTGAFTQAINITATGSYKVTVTSAANCTAVSAPVLVTVNLLPNDTVTVSGPTTFCPGGSVTLTASANDSVYHWSTGAFTQAINVTASGSYKVTVTSAANCTAVSAPISVTVQPAVTSIVTASGPTTFCQGGSVTLTASNGSSYTWNSGQTTKAITVTTSGSYKVTIDSAGLCPGTSNTTIVTVNPLPNDTVTVSGPTTFCQGGNVTLTASANDSVYHWSTGAFTQAINVTASGSYKVTVTSAANCTAVSAPISVTVQPAVTSIVTASGPTTFCQGGSVTLTASNGSSYTWNSGQTTKAITVTTSGSYKVTIDSAGLCPGTSNTTIVTVNPLPNDTVTVSGPTTFCQGGNVTLTASANDSVYHWSTGAFTQAINVTATGSYKVTVTSATNCTAVSVPVSVTVQPVVTAIVTASGPTTFCQGASVTLTASNGSSYTWNSGQTTKAITVTTSGSYKVTIDSAGLCPGTSNTTIVTVNPLPNDTVTVSGPTTFCQGGNVTLTASANDSVYHWSTGAFTQAINVTATGSYKVTVTSATNCTAVSVPVSVTVQPVVTAIVTASGPTTFCQGASVTLTASNGSSYTWNSGQTTKAITVTTSGSYKVTIDSAGLCPGTSNTTIVTVNPLPNDTVTISGPTTFCQGSNVTLTASANDSLYRWSTGAITQAINVTASGTYKVTVTSAANCTAVSAPVVVTVQPLVTATITASGPTTFCQGGSVTLTASNGSSYTWNNGQTTKAISVTTSGSYKVTIDSAGFCPDTSNTIIVTVNPSVAPSISISGNSTICAQALDTFFAMVVNAGNQPAYQWKVNGVNQGANNSLFITTSLLNGSVVSCVVTSNAVCASPSTVASNGITMTVNARPTNPTATASPNPVSLGGTVNLTASATGATSYSWSGPGGYSSSVQNPPAITNIQQPQAGTYRVIASNTCGSDTTLLTLIVDTGARLTLTCAKNDTVLSCQSQSAINTLYANWLNTARVTGPCTATLATASSGPPPACGGTTTVSFFASDTCSASIFCSASFTVLASTVTLHCPADTTISGCVTQAAINAAYANWLSTVTFSGGPGCSASLTNNGGGVGPAACTGGTASVIFTLTNGCQAAQNCVAHFTVQPSPPVTLHCPADTTISGCATQAAINAAYANWLNGAYFSGGPGCSASLTNSGGSVGPTACRGGTASVAFTLTNGCQAAQNCVALFTVQPSPPVTLHCLADTTISGCQGQAAINADFASWLAQVNITGGCNPILVNTSAGAPSASGGTTTVTFSATDICGLTLSCRANYTVPPCCSGPHAVCHNITVQLNANHSAIVSAGQVNAGSYDSCGSFSLIFANGQSADTFSCGDVGHTYSATLEAIDNATGVVSTCLALITISGDSFPCCIPPAVNAGNGSTICEGNSVNLGGQPTASGGTGTYTFNWSPQAGLNNPTASNPTATPLVPTTYTVVVTDSLGCSASASVTINVNQPPTPTITIIGETSFCFTDSIVLMASSDAQFRFYRWNDGETTQTITVGNAGTYYVTITGENSCQSSDSIVIPTRICCDNFNPQLTINDTVFCAGDSICINITGGTNYTLFIDSGGVRQFIASGSTPFSACSPLKAMSASGYYQLVAVVSVEGNIIFCNDTITKTIYIRPSCSCACMCADTCPYLHANFTYKVYQGYVVLYDASAGNPTFDEWFIGGQSYITGPGDSLIYSFQHSGIFTACLTIHHLVYGSDLCCLSDTCISFYGPVDTCSILHLTADFTYTQSQDSAYTYFFNPTLKTTAPSLVTWNFGDNSTLYSDSINGVSHTYDTSGLYEVCVNEIWLLPNNYCCIDSQCYQVFVGPVNIQLKALPNPFRNNVSFKFQVASNGNVQLELYDGLGRQQALLITSTFYKSGNYEQDFDLSGLPSGIYTYRYKTDAGIETGKIIKQ